MTNEVTLTKGSDSITIHTVKVEHIIEKKLTPIRIPIPKQKQSGQDPQTNIIDFKIIEEMFNIDGHIYTSDTLTATEQKDLLISMIKAGQGMTLTYGTISVNCNVSKISIMEVPTDESEPSIYNISISLIVGEDK